jgi:hypothetical protein
MTDDYVRLKVKEALNATDGDRHDAQKLLITWAVRDPALLLGVAKPHLKAIAAALIEHAARAKPSSSDGIEDEGPDSLSRTAIDDIVAQTAKNPFDKRKKSNLPPPKSTERQASTMRKLAAAFTKKRK